MEWVIFLASIIGGLLVVVLIDLNLRLQEVQSEVNRLVIRQIAEKLEIKTPDELDTACEVIPDAEELSQHELARLARKESFEKRIAEMREELGFETYGTHAEELMPEVKNLPHNIIPTSLYDLPSVEIAE